MSSSSELLLARPFSSSSDPEEVEKARSDASKERPGPLFSCCLGIIARLPTASPTWSLILSRLEVIVLVPPPTAGAGAGAGAGNCTCAFIDVVVVDDDVETPCCLMDWSRCSMMAARRLWLWPPRSVDAAARARCPSFDAALLNGAVTEPFASPPSPPLPETKFFLLASHFTANRSIEP